MRQPTYTKRSFLYKRTWEQYQKLLKRLRQSIKNGRFQQLTKARQQQFITTLKRYLKRLSAIGKTSKKIAYGSFLLANLMIATNSKAQNYTQPPCSNSLGFVDVGTFSAPAFVDINGDGLQDAFVGGRDGLIQYFINTGTATNPNFVAPILPTGNPLNGIDVGANSTPFFVDIDGDNDFDVFIGENNGNINFFENTGNATSPTFSTIPGGSFPFLGVDFGNGSAPNFIDIDGDGDLDAFVSYNTDPPPTPVGQVAYFQNTGTATTPVFVQVTGAGNPLNSVPLELSPLLTFSDNDGDGDKDLFIGSNLGMIQYYQNIGTAINPIYQLTTGSGNPFNEIDIGRNAALIPNPCFVDINGDGNMDIFIGNEDGTINYFENNPNIQCDNLGYRKITGSENPANGIDVGNSSAPEFLDIDNDGDQDLLISNSLGTIDFYRNDGTASAPNFVPITGATNPFNGVDVGDLADIEFGDINNDGDLDAFIGDDNGIVHFYENVGTNSNPIYQAILGPSNPLNFVDVGEDASPTLIDVDGDGDLDALIGNDEGEILFFRNVGSPTAPNFIAVTDDNNPFYGVDLDGNFPPAFADVDRDGDLDAIIGNKTGTLLYFRNDGTTTSPKYVGLYADCNPFSGLLPTLTADNEFSNPTFVDINNDGIQEIFTGSFGGQLCFLQRDLPQLLVQPEEKIPTMSQWGSAIFALLLLNLGLFFIRQLERIKKTYSLKNKCKPKGT